MRFLPLALLIALPAAAATSPGASPSPMGGNGHNVTFDGRVFIVAGGDGWGLRVLRPQNVVQEADGFVDVSNAFSDRVVIQQAESCENAIALCEQDANDTPYACNEAGDRGGAFSCYDLVVFDSHACGEGVPNDLRFRNLKVWIANPATADASYFKHEWQNPRTNLRTSSNALMKGIEPSVTRDGKLLVWQGHPQNDGQIDVVMYSVNDQACGVTGWSTPKVITHMAHDPAVQGRYRLAERTLRAADGTPFNDNEILRGGYPWVFPDGEAINFTATTVPCRSENDPAGCGPRRGAWSIIGYPTNWGLAHVDGAVNPDTDQTVRLFFSSPGPLTFPELPRTDGLDVWPFFGSNTSNYTEVVFDDGLDGNYSGVWLMNESVNKAGDLDRSRTPDTSGYFNTAVLQGGASFPLRNDGPLGKAITFNGTGARLFVEDDVSLDVDNAITVELLLNPSADVDCDGNNNWRSLLQKGGVGQGSFSLVFEEGNTFQARVGVVDPQNGDEQYGVFFNATIPANEWSRVAFSYSAATGVLATYINGVETNSQQFAPLPIKNTTDDLLIGAPGNRAACPNGDGAFFGRIEEVRISSVDRFHAPPVGGEGEGEGGEGEGEGEEGEGEGGEGEGEEGEGEAPPPDDEDPVIGLDPVAEGEGEGPGPGNEGGGGCGAAPAPASLVGLLALLGVLWRRR